MSSIFTANSGDCSTRRFISGRSRTAYPTRGARWRWTCGSRISARPILSTCWSSGGAIFEFKAVESLAPRHERQLMQYLFLADLPHGKLVNLRPERVEHKFVNNVLTRAERTDFTVTDGDWEEIEGVRLKDRMIALLRDWGTGLDLGLYEEAAAHLCGQPPDVESDVEVRLGNRSLGVQRMRLASPDVAIRISRPAAAALRRISSRSPESSRSHRSPRHSMDQRCAAHGPLHDRLQGKMKGKKLKERKMAERNMNARAALFTVFFYFPFPHFPFQIMRFRQTTRRWNHSPPSTESNLANGGYFAGQSASSEVVGRCIPPQTSHRYI